jgi:hypothetical protein
MPERNHCAGIVTSGIFSAPRGPSSVKKNMTAVSARFICQSLSSMENQFSRWSAAAKPPASLSLALGVPATVRRPYEGAFSDRGVTQALAASPQRENLHGRGASFHHHAMPKPWHLASVKMTPDQRRC